MVDFSTDLSDLADYFSLCSSLTRLMCFPMWYERVAASSKEVAHNTKNYRVSSLDDYILILINDQPNNNNYSTKISFV